MTNRLHTVLTRVRETRELTSEDMQLIQRTVFDDAEVSLAEGDSLFAIHDAADRAPEDWPDVFVGTLTDFLVRQDIPRNHVDTAEAAWLITRIDADGSVRGDTELALLLNILDRAETVCSRLEVYAFDQVRQAVLADGRIDAAEVETLRRILYACGGGGGAWINRAEAEALFDIADIVTDGDNDPAFAQLFSCAIANHLMMLSAPRVSTEEALRREYWLAERGDFKRGFLKLRKAFRAWRATDPSSYLSDGVSLEKAAAITFAEAEWLIDRLNRDGRISSAERQLIDFIAEDCPDIHATLRPLLSAA